MMEKQIGRHIQTLCIDNSLKFYNNKFNNYYAKKVIILEPCTPQ